MIALLAGLLFLTSALYSLNNEGSTGMIYLVLAVVALVSSFLFNRQS
ncbi:MAG: hypothetical protein RMJ44_11755 [Cytophagales bacterium]|nr:hypothetical protein [Bernardetiaceae bacterium]MDW8211750.1 hypothetical protein [Cytophagales bacterium]